MIYEKNRSNQKAPYTFARAGLALWLILNGEVCRGLQAEAMMGGVINQPVGQFTIELGEVATHGSGGQVGHMDFCGHSES